MVLQVREASPMRAGNWAKNQLSLTARTYPTGYALMTVAQSLHHQHRTQGLTK